MPLKCTILYVMCGRSLIVFESARRWGPLAVLSVWSRLSNACASLAIILVKASLGGEDPVYRSVPALLRCDISGQRLRHSVS